MHSQTKRMNAEPEIDYNEWPPASPPSPGQYDGYQSDGQEAKNAYDLKSVKKKRKLKQPLGYEEKLCYWILSCLTCKCCCKQSTPEDDEYTYGPGARRYI